MDKNAVITGGSDGIGLAIASELAMQGANLLIIARDWNKLEISREKLIAFNTRVNILSADLSDIQNIRPLSEKILRIFPDIDILVNNAGIGKFIPFDEMDELLLDLHLNLNVKAPYLLTKYLYQSLKRQKGNILNISSYFSHRMLPGRTTTAYSLTKGAIDAFTRSLAFEAGKTGIRVNAIAPGSVATEQLTRNFNELTEEGKTAFNKMIKVIYPLQRIGEAEDIAKMAAFLVSDQAKWVTGSILPVDGGLTTN